MSALFTANVTDLNGLRTRQWAVLAGADPGCPWRLDAKGDGEAWRLNLKSSCCGFALEAGYEKNQARCPHCLTDWPDKRLASMLVFRAPRVEGQRIVPVSSSAHKLELLELWLAYYNPMANPLALVLRAHELLTELEAWCSHSLHPAI